MSTTPHDEDRSHNESPAEGDQTSQPDSSREHSQDAAEGDEEQT